jgi:enamine deaminase RidA (YjgF/YER057c/UK114 family)
MRHGFCLAPFPGRGYDELSVTARNRYPRRCVSTGSPYEPIIGISRAVRIGPLICISGTAPLGSDGRTVGIGDPGVQARRCFEISRLARVLLTRIEDWKVVAAVHGEFFRDARPACTVVQVVRFIDSEWLLETEVDAVVRPVPS